jgi:SAM-dependent methyltransferase
VDSVISVHSIYFWPDPPAVLAKLHRALRPGGRMVLAFRAGEHALPGRFDPAVYHVPPTFEVAGWLRAAGFAGVRDESRPTRPTIAWVMATKPSPLAEE